MEARIEQVDVHDRDDPASSAQPCLQKWERVDQCHLESVLRISMATTHPAQNYTYKSISNPCFG